MSFIQIQMNCTYIKNQGISKKYKVQLLNGKCFSMHALTVAQHQIVRVHVRHSKNQNKFIIWIHIPSHMNHECAMQIITFSCFSIFNFNILWLNQK